MYVFKKNYIFVCPRSDLANNQYFMLNPNPMDVTLSWQWSHY